LDGHSGYIILENRSDILTAPQVSFVIAGSAGSKGEMFVWKIDDIVEIKKVRHSFFPLFPSFYFPLS
jgi:hypothetical protein